MADENGNKTGGRQKGTPNKSTKEIRDAFQVFVEGNTDNFEKWLNQVAKNNPAKAIELVVSISEYILPKLSRVDGSLDVKSDGKAISINYVVPKDA